MSMLVSQDPIKTSESWLHLTMFQGKTHILALSICRNAASPTTDLTSYFWQPLHPAIVCQTFPSKRKTQGSMSPPQTSEDTFQTLSRTIVSSTPGAALGVSKCFSTLQVRVKCQSPSCRHHNIQWRSPTHLKKKEETLLRLSKREKRELSTSVKGNVLHQFYF